MSPFGVPQIVAAASAAGAVLDAGCGSARLTLALVEAGAADVVGIDSTGAEPSGSTSTPGTTCTGS